MTGRLPPLETLRYFEACGRHKSFTKAAQEMSVTHGAVSQRVKALEAFMGLKLFERQGNTMLLTHKGRLLFLEVSRILGDLQQSIDSVKLLQDQTSLKISCPSGLADRWLFPRLSQFTQDHPEIDVVVSTGPALSNFREDGIELALRFGSGVWKGLDDFKLLDEEFFPICSPAFYEQFRPGEPADLLNLPILKDSYIPWDLWFQVAGITGPHPLRGTSFSDARLLLKAAADGRGVALGRASLVREDIESGKLIRLFDLAASGPFAYYVVYPKGKGNSPKIRLFCDWLRGQVNPPAKSG